MAFVLAFLAKNWIVVLVIVGLVGLLGYHEKEKLQSYWRGQQSVVDSVNNETKKVEDAWKDIDRSDTSLDDALRGLRAPGSR